VDIQIGRGKTARRAYGIVEIALVPGGKTLDPNVADTFWEVGGIRREIPIIASAMDGVIDVDMAVRLSELGALGVINLDGIQTRYDDPTPILEKIASVGVTEFVSLMQQLYAEPVKPELIQKRIREIKEKGRMKWQQDREYGRRNYSELGVQRYQRILGDSMHAREFNRQKQEAIIGCGVINKMTSLGMPQSYRSA